MALNKQLDTRSSESLVFTYASPSIALHRYVSTHAKSRTTMKKAPIPAPIKSMPFPGLSRQSNSPDKL